MRDTNTASLLMGVGRLIKSKMSRSLPLSFVQCEALRLLEKEGALTMRAMAEYFSITAPSTTTLISALARDGLVSRSSNTKDRREVLLHITTKGKQMLHQVEQTRKKSVAQVLSVLGEHDKKQLDTILSKIITSSHTE